MEKVIKIEELVEKAKSGNKEAYSKLIDSVKSDLFRIALGKMRCEDDAKDVLQETIIKAYLNLETIDKNSKFKSWITKILINECNDFYRKDKKNLATVKKIERNIRDFSYTDDYDINFDSLIESLKDNEKEIFSLRFKHGLTSKEIANRLNMNENSVKSILSRGTIKLRNKFKSTSLLLAILVLFTIFGVTAVCVISYITGLFKVDNSHKNNDGVLMAIEHMDWYQETNMDYIDLGDGYNFKVDYLLMDEMNLYMVIDLKSEKDISKFKDIYITDLSITDENNNIICDTSNMFAEQYSKKTAFRFIENTKTHIKALIYIYADQLPLSHKLNIKFSEIMISKNLNTTRTINSNATFEIDLADKFVNRHSTTYTSNSDKVEKAIITETGFYAIVNEDSLKHINVQLIDEFGNLYKCYHSIFNDNNFKYIIISNFNNTICSNLTLMIDGKEYILTQN